MKKGQKAFERTFAVAAWVVSYAVSHNGNSPTISEIAEHFNIVRSHAEYFLNQLFAKGIAERVDGKLIIIGVTVVPPSWYLDNLDPPVSETDQTENARRNHHVIPHHLRVKT